MIFLFSLLAGLLAITSFALPEVKPPPKCTDDVDPIFLAHQRLAAWEKNYTVHHENIKIDVYMHVILGGAQSKNMTLEELNSYINDLNDGFRSANISFALKRADWFVDNRLARAPNQEMKRTFHQGTSGDLNLFFVEKVDYGLAGSATFPTNFQEDPDGLLLDGCVIAKLAVQPGSLEYKGASIILHEVGHWFGLLHTFQKVCKGGSDDFIEDTPPAPESCLHEPSSCPGDNIMSYGKTRAGFTPGQTTRMRNFWDMYRSSRTASPKSLETHLSLIEPIRNQTLKPLYLAKNEALVYRHCKRDSKENEHREEYCGSRAYCEWELWRKVEGEYYRDEVQCLQARTENAETFQLLGPDVTSPEYEYFCANIRETYNNECRYLQRCRLLTAEEEKTMTPKVNGSCATGYIQWIADCGAKVYCGPTKQ